MRISHIVLDSEMHWAPLDLEPGSIVRAIKYLRGYLRGTKFPIWSNNKALKIVGKVRDHNVHIQRWFEILPALAYTLKNRKGSANGNAGCPFRLPEPTTEHEHSESNSLTPVRWR